MLISHIPDHTDEPFRDQPDIKTLKSCKMNLNSTKYFCRTCLEEKNDLLSLYSVDVNSGMQICDMIHISAQVQVSLNT